jgi:alpha-beta hydrolase superfamily lysophospholipase
MAEGQPHLAIETFGRADDPALLLVMGATASRGWWPEKLCQGLAARGLFVIRYDNRDTGRLPGGQKAGRRDQAMPAKPSASGIWAKTSQPRSVAKAMCM